MKIIFLGTSSGKVSVSRNYSSILFSSGKYNLLVDAGEGISRSLIHNNISFDSVDGILFTHLHPDHSAGLPGLIIQMKMNKRKKDLQIFVYKSLQNVIQDFLLNSYILPERKNFEIEYVTFNENEKIKVAEEFYFTGRKNSHLNKLESYTKIYPSLKLFSGSFLFEVDGKKIVYTSDIGAEEDLSIFDEINPDIVISEANHITVQSIIEKYQASSSRIILTHYSDEEFQSISEILANLPNATKDRIEIARDSQILEI
ncbi:MAG: MBL fold metallo-hydrolase [bacterium]|nr:MBL fold metallo-hydrolase [bacterium]